jgi:signal transduction histidine kinase
MLLNVLGLRYLEKKILLGETISEFFNTTLEIRRFEKNYFLYGLESDFHENREYLVRAQDLFKKNRREFATLVEFDQIRSLESSLDQYNNLMSQYKGLQAGIFSELVRKRGLEQSVRQKGKFIVEIAQEILKSEKRKLQKIISRSRRVLMFSSLFLAFMGVLVCQVLSNRIVNPLKLMSDSMKRIGEGKLESLRLDSRDSELVSLTNAFNKMLGELHQRQRHLVQSEKLASLGTLLSGVAHELNNPLSNISTSTEILKEEIQEQDINYKKELLMQVEEQTDKARNIVRSLLEFSRDKEFKKEMLLLKDLVEKTIQFVKGGMPTKVLITVDIADDIVIFADKQRIQQAFLNLLINSIEAINEEGKIVFQAREYSPSTVIDESERRIYKQLKYCKRTDFDEAVDIRISDTGEGIPPEVISRVFDPFFTTKDFGEGMGLGLSIVHEVVDEHGGCIVVSSELGKGTTFLMRLPIPASEKR